MSDTCELAIHLNLNLAPELNMPIFRSASGVVITTGFDGVVPMELFKCVVQLCGGHVL